MKRFSVEDLWKLTPNKYEAIVAISLEARRLEQWAKEHGVKLEDKATILAIKNFAEGKVKYTIEEES